jgi:hypothetical protein
LLKVEKVNEHDALRFSLAPLAYPDRSKITSTSFLSFMIPKQFSRLLALAYWTVPGLIILPTAPAAFGCSCVSPSAQQFQSADTVFTGKVLAWKDLNAGAKVRRSEDSIAWTFAVEKVFKGTVPKQQQVLNNPMGMCGIVFRVGERYQVYTRRKGTIVSTHLCTGTRPLSMSIDELLRYPPLPGTRVDLNVFYAGRTTRPLRGESLYIVPKGRIFCPYKARYRFLTDRPFLGNVSPSIGWTSGNTLPDTAPWLIATLPQALKPGVDVWPDLPYDARVRGYLGEPKFAHCPHANRIFVVEKVLKVYETDPDPKFYPTKFPQADATWSMFHDAELGYKMLYPPDWKLERLPKQPSSLSVITLRSPAKPTIPSSA